MVGRSIVDDDDFPGLRFSPERLDCLAQKRRVVIRRDNNRDARHPSSDRRQEPPRVPGSPTEHEGPDRPLVKPPPDVLPFARTAQPIEDPGHLIDETKFTNDIADK